MSKSVKVVVSDPIVSKVLSKEIVPKLSKSALRNMIKTLLHKQIFELEQIVRSCSKYRSTKQDFINLNFSNYLSEKCSKFLDKIDNRVNKIIKIKGVSLRYSGQVCLAGYYDNYPIILSESENVLAKSFVKEAEAAAEKDWMLQTKTREKLKKLQSLHADTIIYEIEYANMTGNKASGSQEILNVINDVIAKLIS